MALKEALRLGDCPRLAFVGAGGKTTALFQLARQLPPPVVVSATTHLALEQCCLADEHIALTGIDDAGARDDLPHSGVILFTGPAEGQRTGGLSLEMMDWLAQFCTERALPLLIEADGSRQRPLKAPAEYEPPIPAFVEMVVVVAGLSGLGQPLTEAYVHRPARFATLADLTLDETITPGALARVLLHPEGGLKHIPVGARRVALLNQADTPEQQSLAQGLARRLLPVYDAVISAALAPQGAAVSPAIQAVYEPVAGVILAAGAARRFGVPKLLLPWRGHPLIWHVARQALDAGLAPVVVVAGDEMDALQQALMDLPVAVVHNPNWAAGQSRSVQAGLGAVPASSGAAVFLLADQPQVPAALIRSLRETHARQRAPIVAPLVDGQRGNPALFDRETFGAFRHLSGDAGARSLFAKFPVTWVPWHDTAPLVDIDTPDDYQKFLETY